MNLQDIRINLGPAGEEYALKHGFAFGWLLEDSPQRLRFTPFHMPGARIFAVFCLECDYTCIDAIDAMYPLPHEPELMEFMMSVLRKASIDCSHVAYFMRNAHAERLHLGL